MKLDEAKARFIQAWGNYGSTWGINRTMAQIHALLLVAPEALSADEVMEQLSISRGNVNMNLRALIDWGLASKELKLGERKEFFVAEKDIWNVAKRVIRERKKRELNPMQELMGSLSNEITETGPEAKEFVRMINQIEKFSNSADRTLETFMKADENWFFKIFMRIIR